MTPDLNTPCMQTPRPGEPCFECGDVAEFLHIPLGYFGYYCERCCPACVHRESSWI